LIEKKRGSILGGTDARARFNLFVEREISARAWIAALILAYSVRTLFRKDAEKRRAAVG
jgi:hypothetical protein